jgi:ergothioneine biosynthesis protein EgtB
MAVSISETPLVGALDAYRSVRDLTERLAEPLSPEDQTVQSMPDVSPTKWHRAHTTWFFETFLLRDALPGYIEFHPEYGFLFNSYYEAIGSRYPRDHRGVISRPGIAEIATYRAHVDGAMGDLLARSPDDATTNLVELGLHHEQQHQELLLMDIKHVLSQNPLQPRYHAPRAASKDTTRNESPKITWIPHDAGSVLIGHDGGGFAFDNEMPRHTATVTAYEIADRPVTCGEFREFIDDGGYERPELWLSDGWAMVLAERQSAPAYWSVVDGAWEVFTLGGTKPIEPAEPVCHITYYEADAYARWAGARLPTETEWEAAQPLLASRAHFDPLDVHPRPVTASGAVGEVWEWTASAYLPYPGFRPASGAVGEYNGKFMVNQHVLRGGSVATPPGHYRPTYRNFFPAGSSWPFTGARLARDVEAVGRS